MVALIKKNTRVVILILVLISLLLLVACNDGYQDSAVFYLKTSTQDYTLNIITKKQSFLLTNNTTESSITGNYIDNNGYLILTYSSITYYVKLYEDKFVFIEPDNK